MNDSNRKIKLENAIELNRLKLKDLVDSSLTGGGPPSQDEINRITGIIKLLEEELNA